MSNLKTSVRIMSALPLKDISFRADGGKVCALLGETVQEKHPLKIRSGDQHPDSGCCR